MPNVRELSEPYENFMIGPRAAPDVCHTCFDLTDGYTRCFRCARRGDALAAVAPISYSVAHEQLHHALAGYKRIGGDAGRRLCFELAAVLWRFLALHELCVARAAAVRRFELVTSVPSGSIERDEHQPLRRLLADLVEPTRDRYERLLQRTEIEVPARSASEEKYRAARSLNGESILLIDDTWTTGANAHSAAMALRAAGAGSVAAVVIGRHVNRDWHRNDETLCRLARPFDWQRCALCPARAGRRAA